MTLADGMGQICILGILIFVILRNRHLRADLAWERLRQQAIAGELEDTRTRLQALLAASPGPRRQAIEALIARRQAGEAYPEDIDRVLLALVSRVEELEGRPS